MKRRTAGLAVLLGAAAMAGCAPLLRAPATADLPPTVTLPATQAGVADARADFAALFADELRRTRSADETAEGVAAWLHGVPAHTRPRADADARWHAPFAVRAAGTAVLVVPGLFGDCVAAQSVPFGDGRLRTPQASASAAYAQYADLGLRSLHMVPLPGRASSRANGRVLSAAIRAEAQRPGVERLVVVAYSKGTADLMHALDLLARDGGVPRSLVAVVSVAGVVMGSPLADAYLGLYEAVSPMVTPLDCSPAEPGDLASVTRRERLTWLAAHPLPVGPAYYSVVAHAPLEEMAPPLRWTARQLGEIDPRNDGQLLAADAILPGSTLLAEARADHWDVALPRDRHPSALWRALSSGRAYPREALFRALLKWVVAPPPAAVAAVSVATSR